MSMLQVALQPTANQDSRQHYADTIETPVPLSRLERFLSEEDLRRVNPHLSDGAIPVWGVTPGRKDINKKKWQRLQPGAVVLFARDGQVISSGLVADKLHNENLAVDLWGRDADGDTWEYIYLVRDLRPQSIPYKALNAAAQYEPNYVVQGFNVLKPRKSERVVRQLKLARDHPELAVSSPEDTPLVLVENEVTAGGKYDDWMDVTGERYHFPNRYRSLVIDGREFVYYRGVRRAAGPRGAQEYFGRGHIGEVWRDETVPANAPKVEWKWFCEIEDYEPFETPVPAKPGGIAIEKIADNHWGIGVRALPREAFAEIVRRSGGSAKSPASVINLPDIEEVKPGSGAGLLVLRPGSAAGKRRGRSSSERRSRHAKMIGDRGEEVVFKHLKDTLAENEARTLRWVAQEGEKPGWDIEYTDGEGQLIAVEVKATGAGSFPAIEITAREWEAARDKRTRYRLVLVAAALGSTPKLEVLADPASMAERGNLSVMPTSFRLEATLDAEPNT